MNESYRICSECGYDRDDCECYKQIPILKDRIAELEATIEHIEDILDWDRFAFQGKKQYYKGRLDMIRNELNLSKREVQP